VACRVLNVSGSGYYEQRGRPLAPRDLEDAYLANVIVDINVMSRGSYGASRVRSELRLARGVRVGCKRVARLMKCVGVRGIGGSSKARRGKRAPAVHDDLVLRRFVADAPNRLWCTDITEHPTREGKVYCCAVLDVFSRQSSGGPSRTTCAQSSWSTRCKWPPGGGGPRPGPSRPPVETGQYTSWVFGYRLREAGLLGSMGRVASSVDNSMIESFWSTMQRELLDTRRWTSKDQLASAIFEWIEAWYNPRRRHTSIGMLSPVEFEALHTHAASAA